MAFGVSNPGTDQLTRETDASVKVANKENSNGDIVERTTYCSEIKTTETFVSNETNIINPALAGQVSEGEIIDSFKYSEGGGKYNEVTITKIKSGPKFADNVAPATTTPA